MEKLSTIEDRVHQINYAYQEMMNRGIVHNKKQFAKIIGRDYGNMTKALNGKGNQYLTNDFFEHLAKKFDFLEEKWKILDKDKIGGVVEKIHNPPYRESISEEEISLYSVDAAANLKTIFDNRDQNIIGLIKIPNLPKCDGAIYVRGDSMYPLLKSGDIAIFKEVHSFENVIFGEMYIVDYHFNGDDYLVVKYVTKSEFENSIKLVSYNTHHQPMDIPIQYIRAMALVKASVRLNTMI